MLQVFQLSHQTFPNQLGSPLEGGIIEQSLRLTCNGFRRLALSTFANVSVAFIWPGHYL